MMRQPFRLLRAAMLLVTAMLPFGSARAADIDAIVGRYQAMPGCRRSGIALDIIQNGVASRRFYGTVYPLDGGERPIRDDDLFEIGSITKVFTATLYAQALAEHRVAPNQPAQSLMPPGLALPAYPGGGPITLDDLARHSSGLPRMVPGAPGGLSRAQMMAELSQQTLRFAPGTRFLYSNLGFAVLSLAMERVFGENIENLIPERVAGPLGMRETMVHQPAYALQGIGRNGRPAPMQMPAWPAFDGAGALRSTPHDMRLFLAANMGLTRTALTPLLPLLQNLRTLPDEAGQGGEEAVGLAWQGERLPDGRMLIWKDGLAPGFASYIGFTLGAPQAGVVLLATQGGCRMVRLGRCLVGALTGSGDGSACAQGGQAFGASPG